MFMLNNKIKVLRKSDVKPRSPMGYGVRGNIGNTKYFNPHAINGTT